MGGTKTYTLCLKHVDLPPPPAILPQRCMSRPPCPRPAPDTTNALRPSSALVLPCVFLLPCAQAEALFSLRCFLKLAPLKRDSLPSLP